MMATDTTTTPKKKLTGAALAAPDGQAATVAPTTIGEKLMGAFGAAREDTDARITALEEERERERAEWAEQRESLLNDTAAALKARDEAEAALKKAKSKPSVAKGEVSATPRKLGEIRDPLDRDALKAAIDEADTVEIAFSDGKREVAGLAPVVVSNGVWREHPRGLLLDGEVTLDGPGGGSSVAIAGYALLLDGKAVAYAERSDALAVAPGQKVGLTGDIIF